MCHFCSPRDLRCHVDVVKSPQEISMDETSILFGPPVDLRIERVLEYFAEVEGDDPRLTLILGYARIHSAIRDLIDQHAARQTNGRKPNLFKTQISSLRRAGVFDAEYYEFLRLYARIRNRIAHYVTSRTTLAEEPYLSDVLRLHELSSCVQVWPQPISPLDDMSSSVFALSIAGCLAIELGDAGERKGFDPLSRRLSNG